MISDAKPRVENRLDDDAAALGGPTGELIVRGADQGWWKAIVGKVRIVEGCDRKYYMSLCELIRRRRGAGRYNQ